MAKKQTMMKKSIGKTGQPKACAFSWKVTSSLFAEKMDSVAADMKDLENVLHAVRPLSPHHKKTLAEDVFHLSRLLTEQRREMAQPYWSSPRFISAYLYYFMPWNLLRLARMLSTMTLPKPDGKQTLLLDLGSGPATLPLALALAKPDFRELPLHIVCQDKSQQILGIGRDLLEAMVPNWKVTLLPCSMAQVKAQYSAKVGHERPFLVTQANLLNELVIRRNRHQGTRDESPLSEDAWEQEENVSFFEQRLESFLRHVDSLFGETPLHLLCFEPGTRLGGKIIMHLREKARSLGFAVDCPCTHHKPCPLMQGKMRRSWCHFTCKTHSVPEWLADISRKACLSKDTLSLAPLFLHKRSKKTTLTDTARIISAPFSVPGIAGYARYACSAHGLLLVEDNKSLVSGATIKLPKELGREKDAKSGAIIVRSAAFGHTQTNKVGQAASKN
ncbi:MAG: hypothetical protein IKN64_01610 [Desulfovibrio sp.]|nr:hypothetical protein [Desulfovibrio sp.]